MPLRPLSRFGARLLSIFLLAGCARDAASPVEPTAAIPSKPSSALLGLLPVRGVTRAVPHAALGGTVSGTVDLTIPEAGLTLTVPQGAVTTNTKFTATAIAGRLVAYEFEPHGTTFAKPLQFSQDLKKTSLLGSLLGSALMDGAYFTSRDQLNTTLGIGLVSEVLPAVSDLLRSRVTFPIKHFSGYLVSWH